jgi:hypothetical protein
MPERKGGETTNVSKATSSAGRICCASPPAPCFMHRISLCAHQSYTANNRDSAFATFLRVKNLYSKFCPSGRPLVNNLGSIDPFYPYHLGIVSGEYGVRQDPARHARKQACQAEATTLLLNAGQLIKSCDDSRNYLLLVLEVLSCQRLEDLAVSSNRNSINRKSKAWVLPRSRSG